MPPPSNCSNFCELELTFSQVSNPELIHSSLTNDISIDLIDWISAQFFHQFSCLHEVALGLLLLSIRSPSQGIVESRSNLAQKYGENGDSEESAV